MKINNFIILLCSFGSGSKLLQAHLSNVKNLFTLPAYPLLYLPNCFENWKESKNLDPDNLLKLISNQFSSIFDTRNLQGFNGTHQLGEAKDDHISISKYEFDNAFLDYFKKNEINLKNLIFAIHYAYQKAINNKDIHILYHPHSIEIYNKFLSKDFLDSKKILTIREPIKNFWRSAYADNNIDKSRYDLSDYENLKNFRYINRLRDLNINFEFYYNDDFKNYKIIKFEEFKKNKEFILKDLCQFLNLEFDKNKILTPRFNDKKWWGSDIYKGSKENYEINKSNYSQRNDLNKFFYYEIKILQKILIPFYKRFNYNLIGQQNFIDRYFFWILLFLPTKYGLNLFFHRFKVNNIINYVANCYNESFKFQLKDYYFNAMYKHKYSYRVCFLQKYNFIRKYLFFKKNLFLGVLNFTTKILLYPTFQFELIVLYFFRIFFLISIKTKLLQYEKVS